MPTKSSKETYETPTLKKSSKKKKNVEIEDSRIDEIVSCITFMSKDQKFVENDSSYVKHALVGAYYDPKEIGEKELRKKLKLTDTNVNYSLSKAVFTNIEEEVKGIEDDVYANKIKNKKKNPNYKKEKDESEDELNIEDADSLVLNGKIYDEYGTLEIHVFNYEDSVFNIYDDIIIDAPPLCLEIVEQDCYLSKYLVAIGTLNSSIGLWDLKTASDTLEPLAYLGNEEVINVLGMEKKMKKRKDIEDKKNNKKKENGHTKCVNCLSFSKLKKNLLCSGSKDKTIKLWDLHNLSSICTYKDHKKRVNTVNFHPTDSNTLFSTSLDKTFKLYDIRSGNVSIDIPLEHKPESCVWDMFNENVVFLSDTKGYVQQMDIRKSNSNTFRSGKKMKETKKQKKNEAIVTSFKAFNNPCVSVLSTHYKNLILAASEKGQIVAYDFGKFVDETPVSVYKKKMKKNVHYMANNEDCPNVVFIGSNALIDWDLKECPDICNNFSI